MPAAESVIVDVLAFNVKPVVLDTVHAEEQVIEEAPRVKTLVVPPPTVIVPVLTENPFVLNVPFDIVIPVVEPLVVNASDKVHPPPSPLKFIPPRVLPFVVIVLPVAVAAKVIVKLVFDAAKEPPEGKLRLPYTDKLEDAAPRVIA